MSVMVVGVTCNKPFVSLQNKGHQIILVIVNVLA